MPSAGTRIVTALQVLIATCLPLGLVLWAPGDLRIWAAAVLAGEIAFAVLRRGLSWAAPIVAALIFIPLFVDLGALAEPWFWGSVTLTVGTALTLVILALVAPTSISSTSSRAALVAAIALTATGVIAAGLAVAITWQTDQQFAAAQSADEATFDAVPDGPLGSDDGTDPLVAAPDDTAAPAAGSATVPPPTGTPLAQITFSRPSTGEQLVTDQRLIVREGVEDPTLAKGPGRYPATSPIGAPGNVAIAGHRTGWGSPFLRLDELQPGDAIDLTGPDGRALRYLVQRSELVDPDAAWVLGPDPLGTGEATLTLTTCDPPHSDSGRLVVFATLETGAAPSAA